MDNFDLLARQVSGIAYNAATAAIMAAIYILFIGPVMIYHSLPHTSKLVRIDGAKVGCEVRRTREWECRKINMACHLLKNPSNNRISVI